MRIEAYLLDFDGDIYGSPIRLDFARRLRDEERFASVDELVAQIHRDVDAVSGRSSAATSPAAVKSDMPAAVTR